MSTTTEQPSAQKTNPVFSHDILDAHKRLAQEGGKVTDHFARRLGYTVIEWSRGESAFLLKSQFGFYLALVIEGLGTKSLVADAMLRLSREMNMLTGKSFHANVAQCNAAMAINDLITVGASPLVYGNYLAIGEDAYLEDEEKSVGLKSGTIQACIAAQCVAGPGETPKLAGIIFPETCDLAGGAVGIVQSDSYVINPANIADNDAIVFFKSSGIHANGLTDSRKIADKLPKGYLTELSDGRTYGETLLDPTIIYAKLVETCLEEGIEIHYVVNITGHGLRKLMRPVRPFTYIVDHLPEKLPIFDLIQREGRFTHWQMYKTFNMGFGFAFYVPSYDVERILKIAKGLGYEGFLGGHIEAGEKQVIVDPKGMNIIYGADTLAIR